MSKVKIELDSQGIQSLLKSSEVSNFIEGIADEKLRTLGPGYEKSVYVGTNRVNVSVYAESVKAAADNLQNNTLLKALGQ